MAVKYVAGLTTTPDQRQLFKMKNGQPIKDLMALIKDEPVTWIDIAYCS